MPQPDTNVYRTSGAWGDGKGSNLTPAEVDSNFWGLVQRLAALEDDPSEGVGIADFNVVGTSMTVLMSDGSTRGPFQLPAAIFRFSGEWTPGTSYQFMDVFIVNEAGGANNGLYWVLAPYEAPDNTTEADAVFDPTVTNTEDGALLQLILPGALPPARLNIITVEDADVVLGDEDAGAYIRMKNGGEQSVIVDLQASTPYVVGDTFSVRQVLSGAVTIAGMDSSITITPPPGFTLTLRGPGASVALIYAGNDEWDASGDFTPISVTG